MKGIPSKDINLDLPIVVTKKSVDISPNHKRYIEKNSMFNTDIALNVQSKKMVENDSRNNKDGVKTGQSNYRNSEKCPLGQEVAVEAQKSGTIDSN